MFGVLPFGRFAFGQLPQDRITLAAAAGAFTVAGNPVTFKVSESAAARAFALSGVSVGFQVTEPADPGAFSISGQALSFTITEAFAAGALTINGNPANEIVLEPESPAAFTISGYPVVLTRTGPDYDSQLGGIGHYLLEMEEAKKLAAITREIPPPIDRRTAPTFAPLASPPIAPPAPVVDMRAIQEQRMAAEMAAVQAAKKRREAEAILLLAC